jgi:hypothetical protein
MKKIHSLTIVLLLPLAAVLSSCTSGADEMANIVKVIERDDPAMFEKVMRSFVDCALKDDIDGMIALTSKVTIAQTGLAELKEHYAKDTVPALKLFPKMSGGGQVDYVSDGKGNTGWVYKKIFTAADGKEVKFQFDVLKEQGVIGVGSFGLWK